MHVTGSEVIVCVSHRSHSWLLALNSDHWIYPPRSAVTSCRDLVPSPGFAAAVVALLPLRRILRTGRSRLRSLDRPVPVRTSRVGPA